MIDSKQIPEDVLSVCRHLGEAGFEAYLWADACAIC